MNGVVERQPFPNEKIPSNRLDRKSALFQTYWPEPNTAPYPGTNNTNNYIYSLGYAGEHQHVDLAPGS